MLQMILLVVFALKGYYAEYINIHSIFGEDHPKCGNASAPCKTIAHAFLKVIQNHDVVLVHGGTEKGKPFVYNITYPLDIRSDSLNITLIGVLNDMHYPIIEGHGTTCYLFPQTTGKSLAISVELIEFRNCNVVHRTTIAKDGIDTPSFVNITNSTFSNGSTVQLLNMKHVFIKHCFFKHNALNKSVVTMNGVNNVIFHDNLFTNNGAQRNDSVLLSITNSKADVSNIRFYSNSVAQPAFVHTGIHISNSTATLTFITFATNTFSDFISVQESKVHLKEMKFEDNTVRDGFIIGYKNSLGSIDSTILNRNVGESIGFSFEKSNIVMYNISSNSNNMARSIWAKSCSSVKMNHLEIIDDSYSRCIIYVDNIEENIIDSLYIKNTTTFMGLGFFTTNAIVKRLYMERSNIMSFLYSLNSDIKLNQINVTNCLKYVSGITTADIHVSIEDAVFSNLKGKILDIHVAEKNLTLKDITIVGTDNSATLLKIFSEVRLEQSSNGYIHADNVSVRLLNAIENKPIVSIRSLNGFSRVISHPDNKYNFRIMCPENNNPKRENLTHVYYHFDYYCSKCRRGLYTLGKGEANVSLIRKTKENQLNENMTPTISAECKKCPPGGVCENGIISNDNFWGYKNKNTEVKFLPCPEGYCCTEEQSKCLNYSTCDSRRIGPLCGQCKDGYQVNYLSSECVDSSKCKHRSLFWILYISFALMYTAIIAYLDDIPKITKKITAICKNLFTKLFAEVKVGLEENVEQEKYDRQNNSRVSGIFNVMIAFYQIKPLITVQLNKEYQGFPYNEILTSFFNLQLIRLPATFCPFTNLNDIEKVLVKHFLSFVIMASIITGLYIIIYARKNMKRRSNRIEPEKSEGEKTEPEKSESESPYVLKTVRIKDGVKRDITEYVLTKSKTNDCPEENMKQESKPTTLRLYICMIRVVLFNYNALLIMAMTLFNCKKVNEDWILYIKGDMKCFAWWQYLAIIFFIVWIVPLALALYLAVTMLNKRCFGAKGFLLCLTVPIATPFYYIYIVTKMNRKYPITETPGCYRARNAILSLFKEPFRENVFCWDAWRLIQKLIIGLFSVFLTDPLHRLGSIVSITLFILIVHLKVLPNRDHLVNSLETASLASLCILVTVNLFRAFLYVYHLANVGAINDLLEAYTILEFLLHPPVFLLAYGGYKLCRIPLKIIFKKMTLRKIIT